jgi:thiamine biosynthesis lipoprotein
VTRLARGELAPERAPLALRYVLGRCEFIKHLTGGYFDVYANGALDPSALVKGWSVDVASALLGAAGVPNHAINAGGDIRVCGRPDAGPWRVGIAHPLIGDALCGVVELSAENPAIATSGTAERGAHVTNPHTGRAALDLASVTVVGRDLADADAFATAALAMGFDAPKWLDDLDGYAGLCVDASGCARATADFPALDLSSTSPAPTT